MRRRARRIVGLVVLSLGLGVVTTYGVAWGLVNAGGPATPSMMLTTEGVDGWVASVQELNGVTCVTAAVWSTTELETRRRLLPLSGREAPHWSLVQRMSPDRVAAAIGHQGLRGQLLLFERGVGWPCVAIVERVVQGARNSVGMGGLDLSLRWGQTSAGVWSRATIAFMPVWRGFALDVGLFGTGWLAAIGGVMWWRRRNRMRAWMCPKCRYDLRGLPGGVCPECGSAVKGT